MRKIFYFFTPLFITAYVNISGLKVVFVIFHKKDKRLGEKILNCTQVIVRQIAFFEHDIKKKRSLMYIDLVNST